MGAVLDVGAPELADLRVVQHGAAVAEAEVEHLHGGPQQLVDGVLSAALDEWDVPLDLICCPGEVIRTQTVLPQPAKTVSWSAVRPDQFRDIPFLTELRREMDGLFAHDNS